MKTREESPDAALVTALDDARRVGLLPRSLPLLIAVSGGADSMAMLHVLAVHGPSLGLGRLEVATVDHGLRDSREIAGEIETVQALSESLGISQKTLRVQVDPRQARGGLQAAARLARRRALMLEGERLGVSAILTAHTASDQAETVLLRVIRGTSPAGLAAIRPRSGIFRRPFLGCTRERMRAHCKAHGLPFHDDPSNLDRRFDRAAIRHDLLPGLPSRLNPRVEAALCRLADLAAADEDLLGELAAKLARAAALSDGLDRSHLDSAPPPLVRRVLIARWREVGGEGVRTEHRFIEEILAKLSMGGSGERWQRDLPGGVSVTLQGDLLAFGPTPPRP